MGRYKILRDEIMTILTSVQVDGSTAFQDIQGKPTSKFTGYPAVTILPQAIDSDYITVTQNQRGYGFFVTIMLPVNEDSWDDEVDNMMDLIDATLDALDQSIDLNGKADFLRAVPMQWLPDVGPQGTLLTASIMTVAIKDVNVTL